MTTPSKAPIENGPQKLFLVPVTISMLTQGKVTDESFEVDGLDVKSVLLLKHLGCYIWKTSKKTYPRKSNRLYP